MCYIFSKTCGFLRDKGNKSRSINSFPVPSQLGTNLGQAGTRVQNSFRVGRYRLQVEAKVLRVFADDGGGKELRDIFKVLGLELLREDLALGDQRPEISFESLAGSECFL